MKNSKSLSLKKILLSILAPFVLGTAVVGGALMGETSAKAFADDPSTEQTAVSNPLYDFDNLHYDSDALEELAELILSQQAGYSATQPRTLSALINYIKTSAQTHGTPLTNTAITLKYGQYKYGSSDNYHPLVWMPVYMSTTADGSDAVLTLYLSTVNGPRSSYEYAPFSASAKTLSSSTTVGTNPSNMYGTSYIRASGADGLGNGGLYATYGTVAGTQSADIPYDTQYHKYMDFLQYSFTVDKNEYEVRKGNLYDDIVAPADIKWQSYESFASSIGTNLGTIYDTDGVTPYTDVSGWENYCWPNDAYGTPETGSFYLASKFDYGNGTSAKKTNYNSWINDKVWLPSVTEVGTTNGDDGLWQLTMEQRALFYGNDTMQAVPTAWLRTANTAYPDASDSTGSFSVAHMFVVQQDGSIGIRRLNDAKAMTMAVRPAIHLNLSSAQKKISPPVNIGETVYAPYIGAQHRLDSISQTFTADWFKAEQMDVRFAYDKDMTSLANPINAGDYYMEVTLNRGSNLYFINPSEKDENVKVVKFVIEKAKVGIKWTMDGDVATNVNFAPGTQFYPRDTLAGNEPVLGIRYKDYNNGRVYEVPFEELLRGNYTAEAYIVNDDLYHYNYEISGDIADPVTVNSWFAVGRRVVTMPYITGAGTGVANPSNNNIITYTMTYKGNQYIQLENVDKYLLVSVTSSGGTIECFNEMQTVEINSQKKEFPVVSANGTLTYKIKDVDTYTFNFEFPNDSQFTWEGEYDFKGSGGKDDGARYDAEHLVIDLRRSLVTADFVGLPSQWNNIQVQTFTVDLHGIYDHIDGVEIPLSVRYMNDRTGDITTLTATDGVYTLSNLMEGSYTLYAGFVSNDAYDKLYYFASGNQTQSFKVIQTISNFNDNLVFWQYTHNGETKAAGDYNDHITPALAFEFDYDGYDYIFSLTTNENTLRDTYYVKAVYSGDKFVSDAGSYSITVDITAYYKNVQVEEKSYTLYFNINPIKYDLSVLEWDYDSDSPFTYNGSDHKVRVTPESLAELPGLTVEYSTNGNRIDAGSYTTTATFIISSDHANNYILPVYDNENSYDGTFAFACDWRVDKAKLVVEWLTPEDSTSSVLFTPILKHDADYVSYAFEHKLSDGSWESTNVLKADGSAETYRVRAVLRAEYADNYELENDVPCEFTVESGKVAINVHFEVDGQICQDGAQFEYTGSPVELKLKAGSSGSVNDGYTFEYYKLGAGNSRTKLDSAPFDVGKYVAVVTARYSVDTYISDECTSEVSFEIIKANYDVNEIFWIYNHGDTVIAAKYDPEQGKFVDEQGREVEFIFEYDGTPHTLTVECQQQFGDSSDELKVYILTGEVQTNAGNYQATVDFNYNSDRFNNPHDIFPRELNWTISKQKIDYNEVRWGYINKDGEEKAFDFDEDSFRYTRDENGPVSYTVALIGLPKGVQNLMTYTTRSLSDSSAVATAGNSRAAIGDYLTSFTISGTWHDPTGNYEDFDASTFPLSIPASQTWTIKERELSTLDYDGSWTQFDDKVHDIIELCNIPYTELNYFKVEITFVDGSLAVFSDYEGYNGVANSLYHAGTYEIRLYEKITKLVDGAEVEDLLIWDVLSLEIAKAELEVEWDTKGAYPVAIVKNVSTTDMVTTVYRRENGAEVPLAYVKSTSGEEVFRATVRVSDNYVNDITIKLAANQNEYVEFTYSPFKPSNNAAQLEIPNLTFTSLYYTGTPQNFEIESWNSIYSNYLYIVSGSLTQTEIGEYKVVIGFFKNADAYWKNATQATGEYNRDTVTLSFSILPPEEWPVDYPMLERDLEQWTGEEIQFKIVNWVALSKYLTYEVFYQGESLGDNLSVKHGGVYTIVFSFPESSIGYWKDNPDGKRADYVLQFRIEGDPDAPTELLYPEFMTSTAEYNGSEIQFKVKNWDTYYSHYLEMSGVGVISIKNGVVTVKNIGTYTITFTFKSGSEYTFVDGKTTYSLTVSVTPGTVPPDGDPVAIQKPTLNKTEQEWTGKTLEFSINNWVTIYSVYLDISCNDSSVEIDTRNGIIRVTDVNVYTITLTFKDGVNACWADPEGSTDSVKLTFAVTGSTDPNKAIKPSLKSTVKQWSGKDVYFELANFDPEKVKVVGFEVFKDESGKYYINAGSAIGEFTVSFELLSDTLTWLDDTTDGYSIDFEVIKLSIKDIEIDDSGNLIITDKDGNKFTTPDIDLDDLFDFTYYDKDGNPVSKDDLIPGETYTVKLEIKNPTKFEEVIENSSEAEKLITDKNNQNDGRGGLVINTYTPAQNDNKGDSDSGFNPLWWIAIAAAILAVIAIIGIIIALATRNNGGGYDDGYGYDDYYGDYDDDDDYDDEDDDYDDDDDYYDDDY